MTHVFVIRGARRSLAGVCRDQMALKEAGSHRGSEEFERRPTSRRATRGPQRGSRDGAPIRAQPAGTTAAPAAQRVATHKLRTAERQKGLGLRGWRERPGAPDIVVGDEPAQNDHAAPDEKRRRREALRRPAVDERFFPVALRVVAASPEIRRRARRRRRRAPSSARTTGSITPAPARRRSSARRSRRARRAPPTARARSGASSRPSVWSMPAHPKTRRSIMNTDDSTMPMATI